MNIYEVVAGGGEEMGEEIICSVTITTLGLTLRLTLRLTQTGNWKSSALVASTQTSQTIACKHIIELTKLSISNLQIKIMKNETLISQFTQLVSFFHIIVLETVEQNCWDEKFLR